MGARCKRSRAVGSALTSARRHVTTPAPSQRAPSPGTPARTPDFAIFLRLELPRGGGGRSAAARPGGIWRSRAQDTPRRARPACAAAAVWDLCAGGVGRGARGRARAVRGRWPRQCPRPLERGRQVVAAAVPGGGCGCASRCWLCAVGCWLLAVGCWLLAVGCWPRLCQVPGWLRV